MSESPLPGAGTTRTPGTTERTRRAILDAAVTAWTADRAAPLSEIARLAGVGRSTLHRYYADRPALLRALGEEAFELTARAFADAEPERGTPVEALRRLVRAMFDLGPVMNLLFAEGRPEEEGWDDDRWERIHAPVGALFVRGQREGTIAPGVDADWFVRCLWYLLSAGWEAVQEGVTARQRAVELVIGTLEHGVLAPGADRREQG
ncbi:TetR/AcrR family transcriptional regulator [Streptomyces sp. ST2-7A]|uniref:TetR/AcrR family transcriptional regulator n=1 Tax=Streptomyces sp. ST2-7A TaxID=2907214 RepID=UPI001F46B132|nr:TetR/AcrR family transcriptional regulator [Streptomyces sp. ST2-7A]MCE7081034.1 TetR/AcrR family transcriptional regulator [Streptomyces sp. ST2-7A]